MTSHHPLGAVVLATAALLVAAHAPPAAAQYAGPNTAPQAYVAPTPYITLPLGVVLGRDGYFEVTPAGSIVFYPVWSSVEPDVMHTIFAMMGATSLISERGTYRVVDGNVQFFLPAGTAPGLGGFRPHHPMPPQAPQGQPPGR